MEWDLGTLSGHKAAKVQRAVHPLPDSAPAPFIPREAALLGDIEAFTRPPCLPPAMRSASVRSRRLVLALFAVARRCSREYIKRLAEKNLARERTAILALYLNSD